MFYDKNGHLYLHCTHHDGSCLFEIKALTEQGYDYFGFDKFGFNKDGFDKYGFDKHGFDKDGFDKNEQRRLAKVFKELDSRGVYVMLSNHNTRLVNDLYKDYNNIERAVTAENVIA